METQTSTSGEYNGRDASFAARVTPYQAPYLAEGKGESTQVVYGRPGIGRIPVTGVKPSVDGGRWPAKAVIGEAVEISAVVFREGHDAVAATAVLVDPDGRRHSEVRMTPGEPGTDRYHATLTPDRPGMWTYLVEGWSDPYATWEHDAVIKIGSGVDVELMLEEGARLMERAVKETKQRRKPMLNLTEAAAVLRNSNRSVSERLAAGLSLQVKGALTESPLRDLVSPSPVLRLEVQRERALYSSWYELFPRSEGARLDENGRWISGTFRQAEPRLAAAAAMGFDIVYLPPIHPVGRVNRKGPNNTLTPGESDPGSPWAIGSDEGGHDAIHPDLGTFDDFDHFVKTAHDLGLEIALDLALQCAPDHPWAKEHPEWFTTRADGTIAYAENPPKKYQDIYPINFDNDPAGLGAEVLRVVEHWIGHGIKVFRVDNPHTKPVSFWEWLIRTVNATHPEVLFLAEAFTRPAMMHTLGKVGFHQSYTYFTWRNTKAELTEYVTELTGSSADYMRPNFWPNTPDILHDFLQNAGPSAFKLRAVLAATLSPSWGMYSGYELCEGAPLPGREEYLDSEKFQYRPRDWGSYEPGGSNHGRSIAPYITRLNDIRRNHKSLHRLRNTVFHVADDEQVIAYSRRLESSETGGGPEDVLIVVVNLDPHNTRETVVHLNMPELGLDWFDAFVAEDLITGTTYQWQEHNFVRLDPYFQPAHVLHVRRL
ncbi:alpha-1,4-glucan--maltose-1-phosphate maltosyltransferase [Kineosporia sp. J2-2]|uniref:Alpha-1,4-glucan:maltose-1-phosphate maltosyltransferase n=1 Tax=Kineosporia corallincola TaxID=2835133 RepID=A0ABS5TF46_9ACTN|nr:alpha-1,4-glucan--maltose-1-phosphate maltosyltransferase [Kineosporia corallincola]MBT0769707.1 alpha-1,4-glucan--maltose-1-phosphate maltosyltransferase [Kineosporia corallincola]